MEKIVNKGFHANIYKDADRIDCSNGGISLFYNRVMIVSDIEECQVFDISPKSELTSPLVVIKRKNVCGKEYVYAEPIDSPPHGNLGWMMGGSFIYSCDSRFRKYFSSQPIPLHDRSETQSHFDMLNR